MKLNSVIIIILCVLIASCRSTKYIPVHHTSVEYKEKVDTIYKYKLEPSYQEVVRDSGYSFLTNKYSYSEAIFKDGKLKHTLVTPDSTWVFINTFVFKHYVDREKEVVVEVEKKLSKWQQMKVDWGGWAILAILSITILPRLFKLLIRFKGGL